MAAEAQAPALQWGIWHNKLPHTRIFYSFIFLPNREIRTEWWFSKMGLQWIEHLHPSRLNRESCHLLGRLPEALCSVLPKWAQTRLQLNNTDVSGADPRAVENLCRTFGSPINLATSAPQYPQGIGSRTPTNNKMQECWSPLYKMV